MNSHEIPGRASLGQISAAIALSIVSTLFFVRGYASAAGKQLPTDISAQTQTDLPKSRIGTKGIMGYVVQVVVLGSPAAKAGLKAGDILVAVNDEEIMSVDNSIGKIWQSEPGTKFQLKFLRFNRDTQQWDENKVSVQTVNAQPAATNSFRIVPFRASRGHSLCA